MRTVVGRTKLREELLELVRQSRAGSCNRSEMKKKTENGRNEVRPNK